VNVHLNIYIDLLLPCSHIFCASLPQALERSDFTGRNTHGKHICIYFGNAYTFIQSRRQSRYYVYSL